MERYLAKVPLLKLLLNLGIYHCKKMLSDPRPGKCGLASHFLPHVKIYGGSTPSRPKYGLPKNFLGWVNVRAYNVLVSGQKFT